MESSSWRGINVDSKIYYILFETVTKTNEESYTLHITDCSRVWKTEASGSSLRREKDK